MNSSIPDLIIANDESCGIRGCEYEIFQKLGKKCYEHIRSYLSMKKVSRFMPRIFAILALYLCMLAPSAVLSAEEEPLAQLGEVSIYLNMIKSKGIGAPPYSLQKGQDGYDAAVLAAMADSLRNFGGAYAHRDDLDKLEKQYKWQAELNKKSIEEREIYESFKRCNSVFSKYTVTNRPEEIKNKIVKSFAFLIPGKLRLQSRMVIGDFIIETDEITIQTKDMDLKINEWQLSSPFHESDVKKWQDLYRELDLLIEIVHYSDKTVEFTTVFKCPKE